MNPNVITGTPHATSADYAGFPVMHYTDPFNCVPITLCYPNPYQLAMDRRRALPPVPGHVGEPGEFYRQAGFFAATARIHG